MHCYPLLPRFARRGAILDARERNTNLATTNIGKVVLVPTEPVELPETRSLRNY